MHIYFYVVDSKTYMQGYIRLCILSTVKALIDFIVMLIVDLRDTFMTSDWPIRAIVNPGQCCLKLHFHMYLRCVGFVFAKLSFFFFLGINSMNKLKKYVLLIP